MASVIQTMLFPICHWFPRRRITAPPPPNESGRASKTSVHEQIFETHVSKGFDDPAQPVFMAGNVGFTFSAQSDQEQVGKQTLVFEHGDVDGIDVSEEFISLRRHPSVDPVKPTRRRKSDEVRIGVKARIVERLFVTAAKRQERLGGFG